MASLADIGAALSHPTRARALETLLSGRFLSMTDLAKLCRVPSSSMSEHLAILLERGLVRHQKSGRHRYFSLASEDVAHLIEAAGIVATTRPDVRTLQESERQRLEREGRFCWKHLAGRLGVELREALLRHEAIAPHDDADVVTESGTLLLRDLFAIDAPAFSTVPSCVDYTERRLHMRGRLGVELARTFVERNWLRAGPGRSAIVTEAGRSKLSALALECTASRILGPPTTCRDESD